ncbi:hypothetical protein FOMPIDRAFT_1017230 [Fomitopsis schrenkii]|uniref:Uncharacterized protein n=1 Tax=Fomitopsis schrenkii TaxID=2126942 RepID=S8E6S5_FOMSC|nr:hypothetical protein FOMPIDRAFT_1017230 [Fomitopsis schrenkii]
MVLCPGRRTRLCFGHIRDMHLRDLFGQGTTQSMPVGAYREGSTRGLGDLTLKCSVWQVMNGHSLMTVPGPRVHHDTAGEHGVHPVSGNTAGESWLLHTLGGADPRGLAIIKQQRTVHLRMIPSGVSEAGRDFGYAPVVFRRGETSSLLTTLRTTTQEAPQLMRCGYFAGPAGSLESFEAARQIARDFKPITTQPSMRDASAVPPWLSVGFVGLTVGWLPRWEAFYQPSVADPGFHPMLFLIEVVHETSLHNTSLSYPMSRGLGYHHLPAVKAVHARVSDRGFLRAPSTPYARVYCPLVALYTRTFLAAAVIRLVTHLAQHTADPVRDYVVASSQPWALSPAGCRPATGKAVLLSRLPLNNLWQHAASLSAVTDEHALSLGRQLLANVTMLADSDIDDVVAS